MLLGTAYTKTGRPDEAVAAFERAAKAQKGDTAPLVSAAECLLLHGRAEEALKYLDRALKVEAAVLPAGPPKAGRPPADRG